MADTGDQVIGFVITAEGQAAIDELNRVKASVGQVGDAHDKSSVALKGFSFAVKGVAHELGVSGPMARLFGHEALNMATSLGTAGAAVEESKIKALANTRGRGIKVRRLNCKKK